jgi:hypothetical protein
MLSGQDDRKPAPHGSLLAGQGGYPRCAVRCQCMGSNLVVTERADPTANRRHPARINEAKPTARNEIDGPGDVTGGERVTDRLAR